MNRKISVTALLFLTVLLSGAELKTAENGIAFGSAKLNIWDSGIMSLTDKQGLFTNWYFHFTTKHPGKWFPLSHKSCKLQKLPAENGTWKFKAAVPVTETETADAEMTLSATPFNTVEIECTWKCADPKNILETGFFLSLPIKASEGGKMEINGKEYPIVNETKYGWFKSSLENPEFRIYPGNPLREYTISARGKYNITIGTVKNGSVTIRIIAPRGSNNMKLTFTPR